VGRKFSEKGDVQRVSHTSFAYLAHSKLMIYIQARELVIQSDGIEQTRALAQDYVDKAAKAISGFPESEAKVGLIEMCSKVMKRKK
jgi:hexaprenyl-diphosphate synthase